MAALIYARLMLKKLALLRERVEDWDIYPFSVPVLRNLQDQAFTSRICFFTGENGTGKSTLLEAIGAHYGLGPEGGNRNFTNTSTHQNQAVSPLVKALRLSFDRRTGMGFFLRAESFFNVATHSYRRDRCLQRLRWGRTPRAIHGESFLALFFNWPSHHLKTTIVISESPLPSSHPTPTLPAAATPSAHPQSPPASTHTANPKAPSASTHRPHKSP